MDKPDYPARLRNHAEHLGRVSDPEVYPKSNYGYVDLNQAANHIEDLEDLQAAYEEVGDVFLDPSAGPEELETALHRLQEFHRKPEVLYKERLEKRKIEG